MSEIGASYYRGQDAGLSPGDIVAIVISITFGLPILACVVYVLYVWVTSCWRKEEMRRNGTIGTGCFWCWKTSSQVDLNVDELVAAVPAVVGTAGKSAEAGKGEGQTSPSKGQTQPNTAVVTRAAAADASGSSTSSDSDGGVELATPRSAPYTNGAAHAQRAQQPQPGETVIEIS